MRKRLGFSAKSDSGWEASFDGVAAGTAAAGHSEANASAAQDAVVQQEGDEEAGARGTRAAPAATSEEAATLGERP